MDRNAPNGRRVPRKSCPAAVSRQGVILRKQHNQEGVPDPDDMYCEYYLMAKCGDHTISIPEEWTNCYEKTSNYGYNQVEASCPQCKMPYDMANAERSGGACTPCELQRFTDKNPRLSFERDSAGAQLCILHKKSRSSPNSACTMGILRSV